MSHTKWNAAQEHSHISNCGKPSSSVTPSPEKTQASPCGTWTESEDVMNLSRMAQNCLLSQNPYEKVTTGSRNRARMFRGVFGLTRDPSRATDMVCVARHSSLLGNTRLSNSNDLQVKLGGLTDIIFFSYSR